MSSTPPGRGTQSISGPLVLRFTFMKALVRQPDRVVVIRMLQCAAAIAGFTIDRRVTPQTETH